MFQCSNVSSLLLQLVRWVVLIFLSLVAEPLWTDPGIKSGISVHELISTSKKKKKEKRRHGQTFFENPHKWGKSYHHVPVAWKMHFLLRLPQDDFILKVQKKLFCLQYCAVTNNRHHIDCLFMFSHRFSASSLFNYHSPPVWIRPLFEGTWCCWTQFVQ